MIYRNAEKELIALSRQFKSVAITGPRQSGKTTLVRKVFPDKTYINLENPDNRNFAQEDPRGFLNNHPKGAILDEVQRVPELFSYLQQILDERSERGLFILTGSNNFLLQEKISQSLAGRLAYLFLLPLSYREIGYKASPNELILKGCFPELYSHTEIDKSRYYANYIRTYVERDVRLIKNITDLNLFEKFMRLLAGRTGQLLNMSNLANDTGVDVKTIGSWISVLEMSFIVFRLKPYFKNYNKRIIKMPKLYFTDTGIICSLLGIENETQLVPHPLRGNIFENAVILDFLKRRYNAGKKNNLYFWRDNTGHEIDLIIDYAEQPIPVEIKSSQTVSQEFFKGLKFWNKISETQGGYVVYAGSKSQHRSNNINVLSFAEMCEFEL